MGFWSRRALATGTAWAGVCLIHHHHVLVGFGGHTKLAVQVGSPYNAAVPKGPGLLVS